MTTLAYIRTSTDKQDLNNQKLSIYEYAKRQGFIIDDFIEMTISSRKTTKERRVDELTERLQENDTLIVAELSRLGRSTAEVTTLVNALIEKKIRLITIKDNIDLNPNEKQNMQSKIMITMFSLFAELERDLISLRTKEALACKKSQGIKLGKPKGTVQASKFDAHRDRILELMQLGLSIRKIANHLGLTNHIGLTQYINRTNLKKAVDN